MNSTRLTAATAGAALAFLLAACGGGGATGNTSKDAPVVVESNALVSQDHSPIIERNSPSMAMNPVQRTNMVVVDRVDRPDYTAGVHVSNDGGVTWQDVGLKLPTGNKGKLFAPTAVYDAKGILYVSYVTLSGPGNSPDSLWLTRSGDGGLTFDEPSKVAGPNTFQTQLAVDMKSGRLFSAWLQSDPVATMCLLCFAETGLPIVVSRSDDGGRTWSPPAQVSDGGRARIGAPSLAVDSDGNPNVLYLDYGADRVDWENLPGTYDGKFALVLARSTDKGLRFQPGKVVDADIVPPARFLVYLPVSPGFAVGKDGTMVATWADGRNGDPDILLRRSTDNGRTWSKPVTVNRGTKGDGIPQDLPAVDIAPGGRVDVIYYDRTLDRRGATADVLLSSSLDGGRSFSRTLRLSTASSSRKIGAESGTYVTEGDFGTRIAVVSTSSGAIAAWADTRNGTSDTGKQDIYAASVALSDNHSIALAYKALAAFGILLGIGGVALFVLSRRSRQNSSPAAPTAAPSTDTPPPPPPLVPSPGQV
jgi:hypothetical protein